MYFLINQRQKLFILLITTLINQGKKLFIFINYYWMRHFSQGINHGIFTVKLY